MHFAAVTLLLTAIAGCGLTHAEIPGTDEAAAGLCELAQHYHLPLSQPLIAGALNYGFGKASEDYEKFDKFQKSFDLASQSFQYCMSTGRSAGTCGAFSFACTMLNAAEGALNPFKEIIQIFPPVNSVCKGGAVFKCCRTENPPMCHTAFDSPAPINCEGNPAYGPCYTAGKCIGGGLFQGCTCSYLAACQEGAPFDSKQVCHDSADGAVNGYDPLRERAAANAAFASQSVQAFMTMGGGDEVKLYSITAQGMVNWTAGIWNQTSSPEVRESLSDLMLEARRQQTLTNLAQAIRAALSAAPNGTATQQPASWSPVADLASFRGCRGWSQLLVQNMSLWDSPGVSAAANGTAVDELVAAWQTQAAIAMLRVTGSALPFFWDRHDFAKRYTWSGVDKNRYLERAGVLPPSSENVTDLARQLAAQRALLNFYSPAALRVLQTAMPFDWEILAAPIPVVETATAPDYPAEFSGKLDGCVIGAAPVITNASVVTATTAGVTAVLTLDITDTENSTASAFGLNVAVNWGDGAWTFVRFSNSDPTMPVSGCAPPSVCTIETVSTVSLLLVHNISSGYPSGALSPYANVTVGVQNTAGLRAAAVVPVAFESNAAGTARGDLGLLHRLVAHGSNTDAPSSSNNKTSWLDLPPVAVAVNGSLLLNRWFGNGRLLATWTAVNGFDVASWGAARYNISIATRRVEQLQAELGLNTTTAANRTVIEAKIAALRAEMALWAETPAYQERWRQAMLDSEVVELPGYSVYAGSNHVVPYNASVSAADASLLNCSSSPAAASANVSSSELGCVPKLLLRCLAQTGYYYANAQFFIDTIALMRADGSVVNATPASVAFFDEDKKTGALVLTPTEFVPGFGWQTWCLTQYPTRTYVIELTASSAASFSVAEQQLNVTTAPTCPDGANPGTSAAPAFPLCQATGGSPINASILLSEQFPLGFTKSLS